jgi:Tfp pilus assembly protein PilW
VSAAWVAYIVVGLAISMIVVLGIGLTFLSGKNGYGQVPKQGGNKDV